MVNIVTYGDNYTPFVCAVILCFSQPFLDDSIAFLDREYSIYSSS